MNNKLQEIIDQYVMDTLSDTDRADFEKQMADDSNLRKEVELTQHVFSAINREEEEKVFNAMKSMPEEEFKQLIDSGKAQGRGKRRTLYITISAIAAAVLLFFIIGSQPKYSSEQLFSEYYVSETFELTPSRGEPNQTEAEQLAELNRAIEILHSEPNQLPMAIEKLKTLASSDTFEFQEEATWYLALAYLEEGQRKDTEEALRLIAKNEGVYAEKAKILIGKLEKRKWF